MKKLFEIDNSEKQRILEMHQNATKKNYLSEQTTTPPRTVPTEEVMARQIETPSGTFSVKLPIITTSDQLIKFISQDDLRANLKTYMPKVDSQPKLDSSKDITSDDIDKYQKAGYNIVVDLFLEVLQYLIGNYKNTGALCSFTDQQSQTILTKLYTNDVALQKSKQAFEYYAKERGLYPAFTKLVKNRINLIYDCTTKQVRQ